MKKQKRKWEQAVDYSCVHAFHAAGYDKPDSFLKAKVSDLILTTYAHSFDKYAYCTIPNYPLVWGQTSLTEDIEARERSFW